MKQMKLRRTPVMTVTTTQFCVLDYMRGLSRPVTLSELGRETGLPKPSLSRATHRLIEKGLLSQTHDSVDKRVRWLSIEDRDVEVVVEDRYLIARAEGVTHAAPG